ncbi:MAG: hypothetical protein ACHQJ6_02900 [Candidatus Berkiellales bacterium]
MKYQPISESNIISESDLAIISGGHAGGSGWPFLILFTLFELDHIKDSINYMVELYHGNFAEGDHFGEFVVKSFVKK